MKEHAPILNRVYRILSKHYGPQGWWPVTRSGEFVPRYSGGPNTEKHILEIMVGAILTQNTSWTNVEKALEALHRKNLIEIDKLLKIPQGQLATAIRSSGYFNQKAKKLKALAKFLKTNPIRNLKKIETEALRELLLSVSGIGPETADSILLYGFRRPIFVIDAYTQRLLGRIGSHQGLHYAELQALFHGTVKRDEKIYNEYHALVVIHAKDVCRKKPLCDKCVLQTTCKQQNLS